MPYPWECRDCRWLNPEDSKWGEFYCEYNHYYVKAGSPSCRHFEKVSRAEAGCYLTTAMCEIMNYDDDCITLNTLRDFRDNYMKNNSECLPLLNDYDVVGPIICDKLKKDDNNIMIAHIMLTEFIIPAIDCIKNNYFDDAICIYKDMTIKLMEHYDLDTSNLACMKDTIFNKTRKREIVLR